MTVSVTAARLLSEAFRRGDFTGWPDFVRMDDGQYMSQLMLSVSKRKIIYSVIARTQDPESHIYVFVLCVDQAVKGMEAYHNKVGIMNAVLSTKNEDEPKLVIGLDYGEYLVLDAVEQPAAAGGADVPAGQEVTEPQAVFQSEGISRQDVLEELGQLLERVSVQGAAISPQELLHVQQLVGMLNVQAKVGVQTSQQTTQGLEGLLRQSG